MGSSLFPTVAYKMHSKDRYSITVLILRLVGCQIHKTEQGPPWLALCGLGLVEYMPTVIPACGSKR